VIATRRSDYPNQINNVLAFPGIFRGALDARAPDITERMKVAAAEAIAGVVAPDELSADNIVPSVFNRDVASLVAAAVAEAAAPVLARQAQTEPARRSATIRDQQPAFERTTNRRRAQLPNVQP
jgi:malic enzyme